jgi:hypothetical protein
VSLNVNLKAMRLYLRQALASACLMSFAFGSDRVAAADAAIAQRYDRDIRPLLKEYCLGCHSTEKAKGELDLERFTSLSHIIKQPKVWQGVLDQVSLGEMPPSEKPQLSAADKLKLQQWVNLALKAAGEARAGDPGPVVLRRLNNAEYTYTLRDLTGVPTLDPAREFPVDSASGEGFMNVGNSLVMSPSLVTKYLDGAKEIAAHAVLLPDTIRFSPHKSRRDWTEELLAEIRGTYREYTDNGGGTSVNLQGIRFDTKDGGVLPLDSYISATFELRGVIGRGGGTATRISSVASRYGLSSKYLALLWETLNGTNTSLLLDPIRARWRDAKASDAPAIARQISQWQHALWKFNSVGHIGKRGGPKSWMEPLTPIQSTQDVKWKLPASSDAKEITLYLSASDAGNGNTGDVVVWEQPRFVAPGQSPLLLRDVRDVSRELSARRDRTLANTAEYLAAAAEAESGQTNVADLARVHEIETDVLAAWLNYLGIGTFGPATLEGHFTTTYSNANGYAFISGWGPSGTPNLAANSSDQHVRIPGNMKPHSVALHPSPKLAAAVGWQSPVAGRFRVTATVQHAHPECGNGVTWSLEVRRGLNRQRLANGIAQGARAVKPAPVENLAVQPGDVVSLVIGPRDANHSCDLTAVDLTLTHLAEGGRQWDLAKDVSPDVRAGNPHADRFGNKAVWHFYTEPDKGRQFGPVIPPGSLLAKWQAAKPAEKSKLTREIQSLLMGPSPAKDSPDAMLHRQLTSLGGPLFSGLKRGREREPGPSKQGPPATEPVGLDPARFTGADLVVRAPSVIEIRLPPDLVAGYEFITSGRLDKTAGAEGSVQLQLLTNKPPASSGLLAIEAKTADGEGPWYSNNRVTSHNTPIVVNDGSAARRRVEAAFDEFRSIFPAALCYTKIVPVDEVVTLTLFYREDDQFKRLMLDEAAAARLDRLWDELHYVAQDALTLVDVFEQLWQYATQDADPSVFEPMREPIRARAAAFRQRLLETQPAHVEAVLRFADGAFRRPLTAAEQEELRALYRQLRAEEISHEEAIRLTLARALVSPAFLYKLEKPGAGDKPGPVNDWELATRLSYFLWSSGPDSELRAAASAGKLREPEMLAAQAKRLLQDDRVRRLATEFACAWLHVYDFDELGEKSERHFPTFNELRGSMYEETIRFFTDLFQRDGSVLEILDADHTFVNADLAKHYGIPIEGRGERGEGRSDPARPSSLSPHTSDKSEGRDKREEGRSAVAALTSPLTPHTSNAWHRVDGVKKYSRGGILAQGTTLAKQSGASRTSPILRGNWVAEVLLGEKLPRPPKDVPQLPEDEATEQLTVRQLTEKHSSDPKCIGCHRRIDPYGYSLEAYDAIGRLRERDLGGRAIDVKTKVMDGSEIDGLDGLRQYLLTTRRDAFVKQFCRKLLGYSLGRAVLLSDGPLIDEMQEQLRKNDYRIGAAFDTIVRSRQFREIRGREMASED